MCDARSIWCPWVGGCGRRGGGWTRVGQAQLGWSGCALRSAGVGAWFVDRGNGLCFRAHVSPFGRSSHLACARAPGGLHTRGRSDYSALVEPRWRVGRWRAMAAMRNAGPLVSHRFIGARLDAGAYISSPPRSVATPPWLASAPLVECGDFTMEAGHPRHGLRRAHHGLRGSH